MSEEQKQILSDRMSGPGNHRWKGGRRPHSRGYVATGKRGLEHRLVLAARIGRQLERGEQVHHVNEDRADNRAENLWLFPNASAHREWHRIRRTGTDLARPMPAIAL